MNKKPGIFESWIDALQFFLAISTVYVIIYYVVSAAIYAADWIKP